MFAGFRFWGVFASVFPSLFRFCLVFVVRFRLICCVFCQSVPIYSTVPSCSFTPQLLMLCVLFALCFVYLFCSIAFQ